MRRDIAAASSAVDLLNRLLLPTYRQSTAKSPAARRRLRDRNRAARWLRSGRVLGLGVREKRSEGARCDGAWSLVVFVAQKLARSRLPAGEIVPKKLVLDSLELEVVTDVETGDVPIAHDGDRKVRPMQPGCAVSHAAGIRGQLGMFVRYRDDVCLLSCSHVIGLCGDAAPGSPIEQPPLPGSSAIDPVAELVWTSRILWNRLTPVDVAIARLLNQDNWDRSLVDRGALAGVSTLEPPDYERLRGRRVMRVSADGAVEGDIDTFRMTTTLGFRSTGGQSTFANLVRYFTRSHEGESGAPVFDLESEELLGIHEAGFGNGIGYFTPISVIHEAFRRAAIGGALPDGDKIVYLV